MAKHDAIPPKPGHVVAAAAWKWDGQRYRLQQVIYEPRKRAEPEPPAARRQGLLI
jgi:hypothetical protein